MKIEDVPYSITDWSKIRSTEIPGETGKAIVKTVEIGNIRVRMIEYTPGFSSDHWCSRGHVVLVLGGELITQLKDGRKFKLTSGESCQMAEDTDPHRSYTETGAKLFIVD